MWVDVVQRSERNNLPLRLLSCESLMFVKENPDIKEKKALCLGKYFAKFSGELLDQSLIFIKVAGFQLATLLKNKLWYR